MSKQKLSRTPGIDMDKCFKNAGGNKFDLIIYGAARARQIAKKYKGSLDYVNAPVSALLELQESPYERQKV